LFVAKADTPVTEHVFPLPSASSDPFAQFRRFKVISVSESQAEVHGEIGPGGGGLWEVFHDVTDSDLVPRQFAPMSALALADYDWDGRLEFAVHGQDDSQTRLLVWSTATSSVTFSSTTAPTSAIRSLAWVDYNADGYADLLSVGRWLSLYQNEGPPDWGLRKMNVFGPQGQSGYPRSAVADMNADGLPDIVVLTGEGELVLHRNVGAPRYAFEPVTIARLGGQDATKPGILIAADFTEDGRTDLCVGAEAPALLVGNDYGRLEDAFPEVDNADWAEPADWDSDGDLDLYVGGTGGGRLLRNDGEGRFRDVTAKAIELGALEAPTCCGVWSDLDGNGYPDLLVGMCEGGLKLFLSAGLGRFMDAAELCPLPVPRQSAPAGLRAVDLNGDACPDVCVAFEDGSFALLENRWWARPSDAYLKVQPAGRRGIHGVVLSLRDASGAPLASGRPGLSSGCWLSAPAEYSFGVAGIGSARAQALFSDGVTRSVPWSKQEAPGGILVVRRTPSP
jgi:hypothetical protein